MAEPTAPPGGSLIVAQEFQYSSIFHQGETAVTGMWLFLAQECLFFGALFLTWIYCRYWNIAGFDAGSAETQLWIGSVNVGILLTSSFAYAVALTLIQGGADRIMVWALAVVALLGVAFLCLKGYEWHLDFADHLWVLDPDFKVKGSLAGGAKLFWCFYWLATVLHAAHMTVGIGLVGYVILRARRGDFSAAYHTPVEVVGIYWSFVDMIWIVLWPMIYLIGRTT
ncbi:MAG TPA: cytochrome c oxidase subunit 3 [Acetobacteraceae bacterium]|nr:cytochrome c oxidase subunit 3 [Acetobacteraceae bacterium]